MSPRKKNNTDTTRQNNPAPDSKPGADSGENARAAHEQADKDIEEDADLSIHSPNDDLDESESLKLGEDKTDLI